PFSFSHKSRMSDNNQSAHVNTYLLQQHCAFAPAQTHSYSIAHHRTYPLPRFFSSLSFPEVVDLGLRAVSLGKRSVTYESEAFKSRGDTTARASTSKRPPAAMRGYTHVSVDKDPRTSVVTNAWTTAVLKKLITVSGPRYGAFWP
ncbi:hypothetical protein V8E55_012241, partial [Tylopilus felleus]